ncbi:vezatin-like isoform X1 [Polyodon spathula]|uniref:vezatin-like isoform X1 n=1 Tax=Polyodon spathula TaxID=7913 RepID=UPI001B7F21DA|nr:vezatin-like isoform X1 [Polyodon spathula]
MTEEFDEDVVFENSPLFQYLQDLGHTDFETCAAVFQEAEQCPGEEGLHQQDFHTTPRRGLFLKLADAILRLNPFQQGKASNSPEMQLDVGFRQYSLHTILEQEVLLQEDVELIELLDPSILSTGHSEQVENGNTLGLRFIATLNFWDLSVLAAFIGVLIALHLLCDDVSWVALGPGLLAFTTFMFLRGLSLWKTASLRMTMRKCNVQLEELTANSRAFTSLVRKALRLVQETEVISRGFTLLLDRVSAACPFNKAGRHRSQQLIGLRKAVYKALRAAFRASRLATCHMLKSYPLNSEIDNVTNYVSAVPLKELGLGLSEEQLSDEQAQELTDDYSLPALKVLFQLWVGQSSEFFRRLALLLSPVHMPTDLGLSPEHLMHQVVMEVSGPLHRTLTTCLEELRRSYEFHRYFETQHQPQGGGEHSNRARQKCKELNSLYTAVRSLQLHLKALLNEVIILEDDLEKLMVSGEPLEMTCAVYQDLEQKLKLIQPHMQASSSCWEEAVSQVDKMVRRATNCKGKPETPDESFTPILTPTSRPVTLIEDRDPVPEEQELEAYVNDSESDGEGGGAGFDYLSLEERERQKKEGEESKRVLLELKSVLGLRASEMERQKWKQLLFSDQAILKPVVPAETLEPVGTPDSPLDTASPPQEYSRYNHVPKEEGDCSSEFTGNAADCQTEYCCALPEGEQSEEDSTDRETLNSHRDEGLLHYQYDGTEADTENDAAAAETMPSQDVLEKVLPATVHERLSGLHGSAAISFSSALAAQAAARSYAFSSMQEQTFGEDEDEDGDGREGGGKLSSDSEE